MGQIGKCSFLAGNVTGWPSPCGVKNSTCHWSRSLGFTTMFTPGGGGVENWINSPRRVFSELPWHPLLHRRSSVLINRRHLRREDLGERMRQMFVTVNGGTREHGWTVGFALQTSKAVVCSILCIRNNIRSYLLNCSSTYLSTMLHIMTLQFAVVVTGNDLFVKNAEYYISHIPFQHPSKHTTVRLPGP